MSAIPLTTEEVDTTAYSTAEPTPMESGTHMLVKARNGSPKSSLKRSRVCKKTEIF